METPLLLAAAALDATAMLCLAAGRAVRARLRALEDMARTVEL